jgi:alpha-L-arabinofuranosidase
LEGFHHQCDVLSLANLAQIVNVLQSPIMTEGAAMWLTPTYYALQLHIPHIGATALSVEVNEGASVLGGESSAVTATASFNNGMKTVTFVNRHYDQPASVQLIASATSEVVQAHLLAADSPRAVNSPQAPDTVQPVTLSVNADGAERWRIELPAHSMATVQFS